MRLRNILLATLLTGASVLAPQLATAQNLENIMLPSNEVPVNYDSLKQEIRSQKQKLSISYDSLSPNNKGTILEASRLYLIKELTEELFPLWTGTSWDFNGTSQTPRKGTIACGYFVTTLLRDAGFNIERVGLAQCASETMIKSLASKNKISRFSNRAPEKIIDSVKTQGPGLYVVGLDYHTGFLFNNGKEVYFIHSSYVNPACVSWENALNSTPFTSSRYVVVGKLFEDSLMKKWLKGDKIQ